MKQAGANGENATHALRLPTLGSKPKRLTIRELLQPHVPALSLGLLAVIGEGAANLLEPWPLKIVLDDVFKTRQVHGWLNRFIYSTVGYDKIAILKFACIAVLAIAILDAICSYAEKYLTTSVGQWVTHDLRRVLYSHIQRLSLAYHDHKQTGDLISRVTSDIGNSGQLMAHDLRKSEAVEAAFDRDRSFMIVEIAGDKLYFQTISRGGQTIDSDMLPRGK